jgi:c-di-GMP-binding flagellar brake protein YcgR
MRVPGDTTVMVETLDDQGCRVEGVEELVCMLTDLSEGGVGFVAEEPPAVGTRVNISIVLVDGYIIAEGEVRRVDSPSEDGASNVGVQFTYVTPDSAERLKRTVEYRRSTGY